MVGGGGFIGQAVCAALTRSGAGVTAFGRSVPEARNEDARWIRGDADDAAALAAALERQDIVIHLAGTIDPERSNLDPLGDLAANAGTTISLVKLAADKEADIRAHAVWALGVNGHAYAKATLFTALKDEDAFVRRRACEALVRLNVEPPVEALWPLLGDGDQADAEALVDQKFHGTAMVSSRRRRRRTGC